MPRALYLALFTTMATMPSSNTHCEVVSSGDDAKTRAVSAYAESSTRREAAEWVTVASFYPDDFMAEHTKVLLLSNGFKVTVETSLGTFFKVPAVDAAQAS